MKFAAFERDGVPGVGRLSDDGQSIRPYELSRDEAASGILPLIARSVAGEPMPELGDPVAMSGVTLRAPLPQPRRNIFCVGKNYFEHAHEFAKSGFDSSAASGAVPEAPIIFSKVPESVTAHGAGVAIDASVDPNVDYEVELTAIVGKGGRGITKADAYDHVWGYTIVNDVTARDLQGRYKQWLIGKSQDGFCPMGPIAVTADEIDPENTQVRTWVNGELRQDANTRDLIFDIPTLIETISAGITLIPGDLIATGTPAGVGIGFNPPKYLKPGDVVRLEIQNIGILENRFVAYGE